jgi:hypothetical protein
MEGFSLKIMYDKPISIKLVYLISIIQSGRTSPMIRFNVFVKAFKTIFFSECNSNG